MAKAERMVGGGMIASKSKSERKPTKKHVKRISIERAANGGHIVTHEHHQEMHGAGPYVEPETHTFGKDEGKKMLQHVAQHSGVPEMKVIASRAKGEPDGDENGAGPSDNDGDE